MIKKDDIYIFNPPSFIEKKKKAALGYMAEFIVGVFFIDCVLCHFSVVA